MREFRVKPDQWGERIEQTDGPQLVVAGPGTGKTEFLIRRVAHLVNSGQAKRSEIAVLTFSRRAAADIRRRVDETLGGSGMPVEAATFHSLALRILEHSSGDRPVPLTAPEQVGLVQNLLAKEDPDNWPVTYRSILTGPAFAAEIADFLMRCSERLLSPDDLLERAQGRADWRGIPGLFDRYRAALIESGRTDYGTLLVSAVALLDSTDRETAADYRYVIVDEYQDTSLAQATMAGLLAKPHGNLTVAGDPYQSVYSFRGAELRNVANFAKEHPDVIRIVLTHSLRVPKEILDSALRVVHSGSLPGSAGAVTPAAHPGRVEAYIFDQETAEAEWIAREVEHAIRVEDTAPGEIAVLVRSKRELLNELSRALARRDIPHDPPNSRLVDHTAVRLVADLITVAVKGGSIGTVSPSEALEADRAMRRILLGPIVSLTLGTERELMRSRRRTSQPWSTVVRDRLPDHRDLARLIADPAWATDQPAVDGFWEVWTGLSRFARIVSDEHRGEWRRALASFTQVLGRQAERDPDLSLSRFFELAEDETFEPTPLLSYRPESGRVALTTLHQSKGLEFDLVFIANAVEGVFPDLRRSRRMLRPELLSPERTTNPAAQHIFQVQEEMRLAYTAMTRARRRVVWTATDAGVDQGERRPSRFLVAAAGVPSLSEIGTPEEARGEPVTVGEFEVALRRRLGDPSVATVDRMAFAHLLGTAPGEAWEPVRFAGVAAPGPDRPILGEEIRLSPSQATSYASCPRRYALERRLRLGDAGSPYAHFGTLVHDVLERAETKILNTGQIHAKLPDVLKVLDEVWAEADFGSPELNVAWLRKAVEVLTKLYENWPSTGIPVELETRVDAEIAGIPWMGKIDRLERTPDGLKVIDYKTSTRAATKDEAAISVQLGFYVIATQETHDEEVEGAEMWFPRTKAQSVTTPKLDLDRLEEIEELMETITGAIAAEMWEPRVNDRCDRCSFRLSCPAWPEGRGAFIP